jgi:TP901 family phage tail tape measure protein
MGLTDSRTAMISLGLDSRGLDAGEREVKRKLLGMVDVRGLGKKIALGNIVGNAVTAGFGKLTDVVSSVAGETLDFERNLTRLQIAGQRTAGGMAAMRARIFEVSKATSVSRNELLAGAAAYVRATGDINGAEVALETFGKVAIASGASMEDIASTAAALQQNLKINPKDFKPAFDILITQGKEGAIELNELATLMAGIAPSFAAFKGGTGLEGMKQLGAALQTAKGSFGTAAETVTGLRNFVGSISKNARKFGKHGIRIVEKDKNGVDRLRDMRSIIMDIGNSKLAKSDGLLREVFGGQEEYRFFQAMFRDIGKYDDLMSKWGASIGTVDRDSADYLASTAGKLETAMNAAKLAIVDAFTPERIQAFVNALGKVAEKFAQIVGFVDYIFNDRQTKDEIAQKPIVERGETIARRRRAILLEKYGHRLGGKSVHRGRLSPSDEMRKQIAENRGMEANRAEIDLLRKLSPAEEAEITKQLHREGVLREALGGVGNWGSKGKQSQLLRGGGKDATAAAALALTPQILAASSRDELIKLQAAAIGKAMRAEFERIRLITVASPDATAREVKNSGEGRKAPGGRK